MLFKAIFFLSQVVYAEIFLDRTGCREQLCHVTVDEFGKDFHVLQHQVYYVTQPLHIQW